MRDKDRNHRVKVYKTYIYDNKRKEFVYENSTNFKSCIYKLVNNPKLKNDFIRVENYTYYIGGKNDGQKNLVNVSIFLGGVLILKNRDILPSDIDEQKEIIPRVYHTNGSVTYIPPVPLSIADVRSVLNISNNEWYTIAGVIDLSEKQNKTKKEDEVTNRWSFVTYDWEQKDQQPREKKLNKYASKMLNRDLYGDVLYINENLIS